MADTIDCPLCQGTETLNRDCYLCLGKGTIIVVDVETTERDEKIWE
jgi:hypothetical protein